MPFPDVQFYVMTHDETVVVPFSFDARNDEEYKARPSIKIRVAYMISVIYRTYM